MNILALDTCLGACSAAVLSADVPASTIVEAMTRGHQERLGGMVAEAMAGAGLSFADLDRIAVTVGPGSFTGLRVGLAFAKGLALASARPCVGIGALEAMAASAVGAGVVVACLDAGRDQSYLQIFVDGRAATPPEILANDLVAGRLSSVWTKGPIRLAGSGAARLGALTPGSEIVAMAAPDPIVIARLAAVRDPPFSPPRPLYLRAPDARPSRP